MLKGFANGEGNICLLKVYDNNSDWITCLLAWESIVYLILIFIDYLINEKSYRDLII